MVTRPDEASDDAAYGGIELGCVLAILSAGAVGALRLVPSARAVMRWTWLTPALLVGLAVVACRVSSGA